MAVGRPQSKLAHAPWFVSRRFQHFGVRGHGSSVEAIYVVDMEVRDIAVIAKLTRGGNV